MSRWLHDHSLSIAFGVVALGGHLARQYVGYHELDDTENGWNQQLVIAGEYHAEAAIFLGGVILSKWFIERGSAESKE